MLQYRIESDETWHGSWHDVVCGSTLDLSTLTEPGWTFRSLRQVHGDVIYDDHSFRANGQEGDGLVTEQRQVLLIIKTADCVPLLLMSDERVAMVHAGWRGIQAGIAIKALALFERPDRVRVILGPAISARNYEVDSDLYMPWLEEYPQLNRFLSPAKPGTTKRHLDLKGFLAKQMLSHGVPPQHLIQIPVCTFDSSLPSYRREGLAAGRIFNYIARCSQT